MRAVRAASRALVWNLNPLTENPRVPTAAALPRGGCRPAAAGLREDSFALAPSAACSPSCRRPAARKARRLVAKFNFAPELPTRRRRHNKATRLTPAAQELRGPAQQAAGPAPQARALSEVQSRRGRRTGAFPPHGNHPHLPKVAHSRRNVVELKRRRRVPGRRVAGGRPAGRGSHCSERRSSPPEARAGPREGVWCDRACVLTLRLSGRCREPRRAGRSRRGRRTPPSAPGP